MGIDVVFVRRLVAERRIPFVKIGRLVRFDPEEIAAWIDGQRVPTEGAELAAHELEKLKVTFGLSERPFSHVSKEPYGRIQ